MALLLTLVIRWLSLAKTRPSMNWIQRLENLRLSQPKSRSEFLLFDFMGLLNMEKVCRYAPYWRRNEKTLGPNRK